MGNSDISQPERLIFILMLLSENKRKYSIADIHSRVTSYGANVDERTIRRDIDLLSGIAYITEEEIGNATYYSCGKFNLTGLTFDGKDLLTLSFLKKMTREYSNTMWGKDAESFIDKIIAHTGGLNAEYIEEFAGHLSFAASSGVRGANVDPEFESTLRDAIAMRRKVHMTYRSFNSDGTTERVFHPYEFYMQEGNLSVIGYCELRGEIREFRVSRIKSLNLLDDNFEVREDYKPRGEGRFLSLMGDSTEEIKLVFSKEIAPFILEYERGRAEHISKNEDGTITFTRNAAVTDDLVRWVLSYTGDVEVLAPASLKEKVDEKINKGRF